MRFFFKPEKQKHARSALFRSSLWLRITSFRGEETRLFVVPHVDGHLSTTKNQLTFPGCKYFSFQEFIPTSLTDNHMNRWLQESESCFTLICSKTSDDGRHWASLSCERKGGHKPVLLVSISHSKGANLSIKLDETNTPGKPCRKTKHFFRFPLIRTFPDSSFHGPRLCVPENAVWNLPSALAGHQHEVTKYAKLRLSPSRWRVRKNSRNGFKIWPHGKSYIVNLGMLIQESFVW